jgi:hypothetical protein
MRNLKLLGSSAAVGTAPIVAFPVLVFESSTHAVDVAECQLSMTSDTLSPHSVVAISGSDILLEDNTVEVLGGESSARTLVFGGVWIRCGSTDVTIRNNRIIGGYGHGITIGSVNWMSSGVLLSPNPGPGAGPMTNTASSLPAVTGIAHSSFTVDSITYAPQFDTSTLARLTIVENHISQMGTSGISVLTLMAAPVPTGSSKLTFFVVEHLVIERNTICQNLRQIRPVIPIDVATLPFTTSAVNKSRRTLMAYLPLGGVVLPIINGSCDLRGNVITENRYTESSTDAPVGMAVNGIFVLADDDISICDNRVADNGTRLPSTGVDELAGIRAGIAVMIAGVGKITTDRGLLSLASPHSPDAPEFSASECALRVFNNTVRHAEGRALQAASYGPTAVFGNFFSSDGYRGAERGASATANLGDQETDSTLVGDVVFVESLAVPWERYATIPSEHTPGGSATTSAITAVARAANELQGFGDSAGWFANGRGGHLMFHSNQVTFAWDRVLYPTATSVVSYYPVALIGIDHVGVHGNQLEFRVNSSQAAGNLGTSTVPFTVVTPLVTQLFASAHTVNVSHNRLAESLNATLFSAVTFSRFLGSIACNQGTHSFKALGPRNGSDTSHGEVANQRIQLFSNQVLYDWQGLPPGATANNYTPEGLRNFFEQHFNIVKEPGAT